MRSGGVVKDADFGADKESGPRDVVRVREANSAMRAKTRKLLRSWGVPHD